MNNLELLLERVRSAAGPDLELDADLWLEFTHGAIKNHWSYIHRATGQECFVDETRNKDGLLINVPAYTASIEAAIALVERVLPGWWVTCGLCSLTGHASVGPDYNGPHRRRLLREFPQEKFDRGGFDADLSPGDGLHRVALAIISAMLSAKIAMRKNGDA